MSDEERRAYARECGKKAEEIQNVVNQKLEELRQLAIESKCYEEDYLAESDYRGKSRADVAAGVVDAAIESVRSGVHQLVMRIWRAKK